LGTALLAPSGCKKPDSKAQALMSGAGDGGVEAPVPVEVVELQRGRIEDALRFSATLRAETQVQVLARTIGQVKKRNVEEGDKVKAGEVLATLDRAEQASAVRRTKTELELATGNLEKQKKLQASGVVSDQSLENAEFEVKRLKIALQDAQRSLKYTTIRAPISGTITLRSIKRGDLVNPNQPLFEITDFDSLIAEIFVPEKDISRVDTDSTARLTGPDGKTVVEGAEVARLAPVVDPRTGTVKVTIGIPKDDALRPGMFVDVELVVDEKSDAVLLPRRALVYDNDEPYAFKLTDGDKVKRIRVEPVVEDRQYIEPKRGFEAGDKVVVAGQVGLKDGAKVDAKAGTSPPSAAADDLPVPPATDPAPKPTKATKATQ
jgi:membrane fusion protein (multidrug efflux system)